MERGSAGRNEGLDKKQIWDLVKLQHCEKVVGCKWVFIVKFKVGGSIDRYKAKLVVKWFTQNLWDWLSIDIFTSGQDEHSACYVLQPIWSGYHTN